MKRVVILGSTGSIGRQTLDVLSRLTDRFSVVGVSAKTNIDRLAEQIQQTGAKMAVVESDDAREHLQFLLKQTDTTCTILTGCEGLCQMSSHQEADIVVVGVVGFAGVQPTLAALEAGKRVLTANKETFVAAGHLVKPWLNQIIPLDSEHSALFQCLQGCQNPREEVRKLYLTASGGPFRTWHVAQLEDVTPEQALKHPNWSMGPKVTIDSATMMNKGLEIIEALHLFGLPLEAIDVVIHPQSIVHSAVAYTDGSIIAQMGKPDMRVPIQYGLTYPERLPIGVESLHLDLTQLGQLDFEPADTERFPCLALARWAAQKGGTMPVVLNAADEVAVQAFLNHQIAFTEIPKIIEQVMHLHQINWDEHPDWERICQVDAWTRSAFEDVLAIRVGA